LSLSTTLKRIGGVVVYLHSFLTTALDGGERLTPRPRRFSPVREPRYPVN